jgi:hypothetical protein
MNESEFRDWTRGQLHSFDVRLKTAVAEMQAAAAAKYAAEGRIRGEIASLADDLRRRVLDKKIAGLAIAFVTVDGVALSGFAAAAGTYFALAGAANLVGLEVLEGFRQWAAAEAAEEAKNGQDGGS